MLYIILYYIIYHISDIIYYILYIIYYVLCIIYYISYIIYYILYIIYYISYIIYFSTFFKSFFWAIFELLMSPTSPEHLISYCLSLWSWFLIIWEGLVWFLDFWKTSHFCRVVSSHSRRFWLDTASLNLLVFLNSVLDTQDDLKPPITQYNICCTHKKRLD